MFEILYLLLLLLFSIALLVITAALVMHTWYMQKYLVPFVPSKRKDVDAMLRNVTQKEHLHVLDLGSGSGKVLAAFAREGARVTGIEINPFLVWLSKLRLQMAGIPRDAYTVRRGDFFSGTLPDADVVVLYLMPEINDRLCAKLARDVPGALAITNRFDLGDWQPISVEGRVRVYRVPG